MPEQRTKLPDGDSILSDPTHENGHDTSSSGPKDTDYTPTASGYARVAMDTVRESLLVLDLNLHVVSANKSFYDLFELSPEDTEGQLVYELGNGQWNIPELHRLLEEALLENHVCNDFQIEHDFGPLGHRKLLVNARLVEGHDRVGDHSFVVLTIDDITERTRAEKQLRQSEGELADFFENATVAMHWVGPDGLILRANQAELDLLGYSRSEYVGRHVAEFHADQDTIDDILRRLGAGEELHDYEARLQCKDGSLRYVLISSNVRWENGKFIHTRCITRDITERKRTEQLQEEQRRLLEMAATGTPLEGCLTELCAGMSSLNSGMRAAILLADDQRQSFQRPTAPDLLPSFGDGLEDAPINDLCIGTCGEAVFRGQPITSEDIAKDETWPKAWRDLCVSHGIRACCSTPILGVDGQPLGSLMLCFDEPRAPNKWEQRLADFGAHFTSIVLERNRSSQALRESEEKYRTLFESMDEGWCIIEKVEGDADAPVDFRFVDANPAFAAQSGVGDVVGKTIRQVVPGESEEWFLTYDTIVESGEPVRFEHELVTKRRVLEVYAFRVGDEAQKRVGVIFTDITERKRREERDQFLVELNRTLRPLGDPDEIVTTAARLLGEHLDVDRCTYAEVDASEDHFIIRGGYDRGGTDHTVRRLPTSAFGVGALRLMRQNRPYVVHDVDEDERVTTGDRPIYRVTSVRSLICVPLHKEGRFVAGLAAHQRTPRHWSSDEIKLVETVTNRCWEAIERAKVARDLRESEERFRATFERATIGMAHLTPDGTWIRANRKLCEILGYDREELSQLTFQQLTHPDDQEQSIRLAQQLLDGTIQSMSLEKRYIRKDGSVIWVNLTSTLKRDAAGRPDYFISATEDITDRKRTEEALRRSEAQLETDLADAELLQGISTQLIYEENVDALYEKILDAATGIMRSEFASMQLLYPARRRGGELRLLAFRGFKPQAAKSWEWVDADSATTSGIALRTGERVIVPNIEKSELMANTEDMERHLQAGVHAIQNTPLISRSGQVLGMISTYWREPHQPSERSLRLLDILARQTADLIERKLAEDALRESNARLASQITDMKRLHALNTRLLLQDDVEAALHEVMAASAELLHADKANVQIYNKQDGVLKLVSHIGFDREFVDRFQIIDVSDFSTCAAALRQRERVLVEDLSTDPDFAKFSQAAAPYGVLAALSTPLYGGDGHLFGVFTMYWDEPHRPTDDELQMLDLYTQQAKLQIERTRTEEVLRELNETLEERVAKRTAALVQSEKQLRDMASRLTMAEQEERRRISKILHDDLQQQLFGIQMKLSFVRQEMGASDMDAVLKNMTEAEEWLVQGVEMTRQLTVDLSPPILDSEGLADMLGWLIPQMHDMHGLDVVLEAVQPFRIADEDMRVLLFQSVRELLFNVVKHAGAERATITLQEVDGRLVICVTDDGCGFDVDELAARDEPEGGFGLFSVRERLGLFDGRMEIESTLGKGTCVTLNVPLSLD